MERIKTAVIGAGFMGRVHTEGIRRLGNVDVVAVAAITEDEAKKFAASTGIARATGNYKELLADPEIQAVHVCTPNALHAPVALEAMNAGKHVLCEKPLAMSAAEAAKMVEVAKEKKVVNCVNHNLRYYPCTQHIRQMIAAGELGEILVVQGTYSQDWLLYDTDYNWRIEKKDNGALRVVGDIGSHWMDMIQHVTGMKITELSANLNIVHKTRKRPKFAVETFAGKTLKPEDYEEVKVVTEDFGMCMLKLGPRCRGAFTVSQVSAGCKNRFQIEIFGTKSGVIWNQENPNELWIGRRNEPNMLVVKDPSLLRGAASGFAEQPGGHAEGYADSHKQVYKRFYQKIANPKSEIDFPTFAEGLWGMQLLEKIIESNKTGTWVKTK